MQVRGLQNFAAKVLLVESGRFGTSGLSQALPLGLKEVQAGSNDRVWAALGRGGGGSMASNVTEEVRVSPLGAKSTAAGG